MQPIRPNIINNTAKKIDSTQLQHPTINNQLYQSAAAYFDQQRQEQENKSNLFYSAEQQDDESHPINTVQHQQQFKSIPQSTINISTYSSFQSTPIPISSNSQNRNTNVDKNNTINNNKLNINSSNNSAPVYIDDDENSQLTATSSSIKGKLVSAAAKQIKQEQTTNQEFKQQTSTESLNNAIIPRSFNNTPSSVHSFAAAGLQISSAFSQLCCAELFSDVKIQCCNNEVFFTMAAEKRRKLLEKQEMAGDQSRFKTQNEDDLEMEQEALQLECQSLHTNKPNWGSETNVTLHAHRIVLGCKSPVFGVQLYSK